MAELRPDRLIALREQKGISQSELARRAGIGQSTIVRLEAGTTRNPRAVMDLARELDTTAEYLLGEIDEPFRQPSGETGEHIDPDPVQDTDLVELPEIDLRYGLGGTYVDGPISAAKRRFSRAWLRNLTNATPETLFWSIGDGDSMEPTIRSGEVMLIDRSQKTPKVGDGIWAVAWGQIGMIKRLRPTNDGGMRIMSDNPNVREDIAYDGELQVLGRVVGVFRKM